MGHLTVMKSMGTCWQIHLEPRRERERESETALRREGRQWLNTDLTIKTASSVVFEVAAARRCNSLYNLQRLGLREKRKEKKTESSRFFVTYKLTLGFQNITCFSAAVGQLPVTSPFFLFPTSSSMSPVWYCDRADADHSPQLSAVQPAVRQELSDALGAQRCKRVHAFDD